MANSKTHYYVYVTANHRKSLSEHVLNFVVYPVAILCAIPVVTMTFSNIIDAIK